ncbi:MAG: acetyl-CoA carboxylase, carboxyltransferase subunit beta [Parachlamydiales bacterium]
MGLFSRVKPKLQALPKAKENFNGWQKCEGCEELIHQKDLEKNLQCCPKCDHHYRLSAKVRIATLTDPDSFKELFGEIQPVDALHFVDTESYKNRIKAAQKRSGAKDAVVTGIGMIRSHPVALAALDFDFMGGSMGSVMGEKLTRLIEHAAEKGLPLVIVSASGGARMQESFLSLMQMAKTASALNKLSERGLPFISVLTHPTSGGVTASFAALGDVIIAEPKALICFAGPRVIEQTIKQTLPEGAQRSEFLLKHGMIDRIVPRSKLQGTLATLLEYLTGNGKQATRISSQELVSSLKQLINTADEKN